MTQNVYVLIPTYNERDNISVIVKEIFDQHPSFKIVVIDDNSPDGTGDVVRELQKQYPRLQLFSREKKEGLGAAYIAGIRHVLSIDTPSKVFIMDADGSHGVEYLGAMLRESEKHQLVVGSRYVAGGKIDNWEGWRSLLSQYGNFYSRLLTGLPVRDLTAGFCCFDGVMLSKMNLNDIQSSGYAFQIDMKFHAIHSMGASAAEVPIVFKNRREGESKMTNHIIREGLRTPLRLFLKRVRRKSGNFMTPACPICTSESTAFFSKKNGHDIFDCGNCRLLFVHPIPHNLADIYGENYFDNSQGDGHGYTHYDEDKEPMRPVFQHYLNKLGKLTTGRKIFDVGAATGYFLDMAKQAGWKTSGSEISQYAAEESCRRGHAVVCEDIVAREQSEKVDVVTLWDVLEHVNRPMAFLTAVNHMLPKGGIVAINTVDRSSLWARILGSRWHLIVPPEHLYYYTPENLMSMLRKTGFEVVEITKIGKKFSLSYIFKTLYNWQGLGIWHTFAKLTDRPWLRKFAIPINLRDNMFVLARKVSNTD